MRVTENALRGESLKKHLKRAHGDATDEVLRQYLVMKANCPLVLDDLMKLIQPLTSTVVLGDAYGTHVLEGGRQVFCHVMDVLEEAELKFGTGESDEQTT